MTAARGSGMMRAAALDAGRDGRVNRTDLILLVGLPGAATVAGVVLSRLPGREAAGGELLALAFLPWVA